MPRHPMCCQHVHNKCWQIWTDLQTISFMTATISIYIPMALVWLWSKFPSRSSRYEDFCLDPFAKTKRILGFIRRDSQYQSTRESQDEEETDLPEPVRNYLNSHAHTNQRVKKTYTTYRDSAEIYQNWRQIIDQKKLTAAEAHCDDVIHHLNHRIFDNVSNARNMSIPLFETRMYEGFSEEYDYPEFRTTESISADPRLSVLLLSSVGRSGSSFLGEILASTGNNMYFFEPIRNMPEEDQTEKKILAELRNYFHCKLRDGFLSKLSTPYKEVRHYITKNKKRGEISKEVVSQYCKREPVRIIKTIRTRLEWVEELLQDEALNLKVIHLLRDPRGNAESMEAANFPNDLNSTCSRILQDIEVMGEMQRRYPDKYFFIKYEDLCLDPYSKTKEILRFLRGDQQADKAKNTSVATSKDDLPESVREYLDSHVHTNPFVRRSVWSTTRDTSSVFQKWRLRISQAGLERAENLCKDVILRLNHRIFGTTAKAKNMSLSLFEDP